MPWSYFYSAGRDPIVLVVGIVILLFLIIISFMVISSSCKDNKIRIVIFIAFFIQLIIIVIDNYIKDFPLINLDARAHEGLAWFSYINNVNVGRGKYNYLILNPIYKLLGVRVAIIFSAINVFCNILINLNLYKIMNILQVNKKLKRFLMYVCILSPISLIYRSGILREALIILFISYSLKSFITFIYCKKGIESIKMFIYLILGSLFHSGVIFLTSGYFIFLLSGKKNQKVLQLTVFVIAVLGFIIFQEQLFEKVGGGDIDKILAYNNDNSLKSAGSAYLVNITTESLGQIGIYLPLFIFYFVYSPTPDMFRGVLDIITFALNSSIYIYITIVGILTYRRVSKKLTKLQKQVIKALLFSALFTIAVFSVGTRNAGTAVRHRDKILPFLIVIFAIIRNRYIQLKLEKLNRNIRGVGK